MGIKRIFQKITPLDRVYTSWKWREKKVSYGEAYPEKTFFVIRRAYCKVGLFSHVMTNMGLVDYAVSKGYIPIIDMQNGRNTYLEEDKVGKENAWEYYFRQPCGYGLEDIAHAKNVILSSGLITSANRYPDFRIVQDQGQLDYWRRVFQKWFRITDEIQEELQKRKDRLFSDRKVLGILARGTDYKASRPKGHPIQPTIQQIIAKAKEMLQTYSCEMIYLATEDADIYEALKSVFGEQLKASDQKRYRTGANQNINDLREDGSRYRSGREYLLSMMLLAQCNCLLAGNVGGTHGVLLMTNGFEGQYIFDLGMYD